ncbi:urea ABC transporter permease subunit UrtC [Trujillonella endophytica]|uniref:Urea transport system permease protein n=1 Tax=Trujillonella endophytica TaxID=673521 RepID=A0A1H8SAD0_9ACTN|nr:urea ABC transporter permease subunit UrtC [Trujillella endophytica]SEO75621.1 urea transport system permease protein [Trujillella endophytica]
MIGSATPAEAAAAEVSAPRARGPWTGRAAMLATYAVAAIVLFGAAPAMLTDFRLRMLAQFLCVAMVAVGIGLAWGSGGMLTLGQGLFFGLGAYIMAMHLQLSSAGPSGRPAFMVTGSDLPWWWELFRSPATALLGIVAVPGLLALLLGLSVFRRRVKGAYFAILSQASAAAFALLLISQQNTIGGSNGLSSFRQFFGFALNDPVNRRMLYFIAAGVLIAMVAVVHQLRRSRYGELLTAVRDGEERARFLGYDTAMVKVVAYVVAAVFAAIGGALFVPIVGIISPQNVGVVPSIGFLVGVAVGGRATLFGPVLGSLAVSYAGSTLSEQIESGWVYVQGFLFILVVAFLPGGLGSIAAVVRSRRRRPAADELPRGVPEPDAPDPEPTPADVRSGGA